MSEESKTVWYHCGHCGSLFQSDFGPDPDRVCSLCEQFPGTGLDLGEGTGPAVPELEVIADPEAKKRTRRKRKRGKTLAIVAGWAVLMGGSLAIHKHYKEKRELEESAERDARAEKIRDFNARREALLASALPACQAALGEFLTASPENRADYIWNAESNGPLLSSSHGGTPIPEIDPAGLERVRVKLFNPGSEWMLETAWKAPGGIEFEIVFRQEQGIWKIDWKQFVRYSEAVWEDFVAGGGESEAEFRLLARIAPETEKRKADEDAIILQICAPEFGKLPDFPEKPVEIWVDRRSEEGLLLSAAFSASKQGELPFHRSLPEGRDPENIRFRARIARRGITGFTKFRIERLAACHWLDSDETGFDLDRLKDDLFGNR